jgi:hypothetical protein
MVRVQTTQTEYPLIELPDFANKAFSAFNKKEAKAFYQWFMYIKEERLEILIERVQTDMGGWNADYSAESFEVLYAWFKKNITIRNKTEQEKKKMQEIVENSIFKNFIKTYNYAFTDETIAICFDIGIYFGEAIAMKVPELKWTYLASTNKFVDYAQPILITKASKNSLNPRPIIGIVAGKLVRKEIPDNENEFVRLFNVWIENW